MRLWNTGRATQPSPAQEMDADERRIAGLDANAAIQPLIRLAQRARAIGDTERSVRLYLRLLDLFLESGRVEACRVVCRKLLDVNPDMLRPRCTLAWLELGGPRPSDEIAAGIRDYAMAAKAGGMADLAIVHLRWMEEVTGDPHVREAIGDALITADAIVDAEQVLGVLYGERNGLRPAREVAADAWMARMVEAVSLAPPLVRAQGEAREAPRAPIVALQPAPARRRQAR